MSDESHLWSGRFDSAPDEEVFRFQASFGFDRRLFDDDVEGSLAWAAALAAAGVLSAVDAGAIREALIEIRQHGRDDPSFVAGPDEDVHAFVERQLVDRLGDVGRRLHTGRSRNEQVSLDLRLYLRRRLPVLQREVVALVGALADRAAEAGQAIMPAYTHLRRAQPILVAHFLLAHAAAFQRDHARLDAARGEADAMPLGSGAVAGTSYAVDTAALARRLGFSRVVANSIDAAADRDFVASTLHACALTMVHVSRFAEEIVLWASAEFGLVHLDDAFSTGSSIMPQKRNPDVAELARGKSARAIGNLVQALTLLKGQPLAYNRDLQEDKEPLFDSVDTLLATLGVLAAMLPTLRFDAARGREAAAGDFALATDLADHLVQRGVPFREAHEVVGALVADCERTGRTFEDLTLDDYHAAHPAFGEEVLALSIETSLAARSATGGTAPTTVAQQREAARGRLREEAQ